ncbi:MAG: hypothetical protein K9N23_17120 [Akkermansiaceae bacterium]|nr:hypothetical protein [Akkermansiaceae bacterium]
MPVFPIACWALGLMAFCQLLVAGLALGARFEAGRQVRVVEKEVVKIVAVPAARYPGGLPEAVVTRPPVPVVAQASPEALRLPPPRPLEVPPVADPLCERLVTEAKQARVAGDMGLAILKLEEAKGHSPEEPVLLYEFGQIHEAMGVFDTASDYYEKVVQLGAGRAGALYLRAAEKLRDGFLTETPIGKLRLGRVRVFNNPDYADGQQVVLTIPVERAPGEVVDPLDLSITVEFFNRSRRDGIVPLEDNSWAAEKWVSEPCDWADGEETLRMTYVIPNRDQVTDHLFGELSYCGQVVSLHYKGEVVDMQAWPPALAARSRERATSLQEPQPPEFFDPGNPPPDFDPNNPMVLPSR